jgi:hypothetical protein
MRPSSLSTNIEFLLETVELSSQALDRLGMEPARFTLTAE